MSKERLPSRSLEAMCEEAMLAIDKAGEGRLTLPQFRTALRRVFGQLQGLVPQPDEAWFGKVFENYAARLGGYANSKCLVDVAKQYVSHHERKAKERGKQGPMPPTPTAPETGPHAQQPPPQAALSPYSPQQMQAVPAYAGQSPKAEATSPHFAATGPRQLGSVSPLAAEIRPAVPQSRDMANMPFAAALGTQAPRQLAQVGVSPPTATSHPSAPSAAYQKSYHGSCLSSIQLPSQVMFPINCERLAIFENYEFEPGTLGEGSFGRVCVVKHRTTGVRRACKTIGVETAEDWKRVETEIELLKKLDHPHIIRLSESFVDVLNIYLMTDLCEGGPLLEGFVQRGHSGCDGEAVCAACLQQILSATAYCHGKGIIHRDLKPDNVVYVNTRPESAVKVIDFGLSDFLERLRLPCTGSYRQASIIVGSTSSSTVEGAMQRAGTFLFMAPEMLERGCSYAEKVDLWAIGVILFLLVTGVHPFWRRRMHSHEVREQMKLGQIMEHPNWLAAPSTVRDLAMRLLTVDPDRRTDAAEALQHPWLRFATQNCSTPRTPANGRNVFEDLRRYQASSKLKKAVLKVLAKEMDEARIQCFRDIFRTLDTRQDGFLTRDQLLKGMREHLELRDLTSADLELILPPRAGDRMSFNEFMAALLVEQGFSRAELLNAFRRFDVRREGRISMEALSQVLKRAGPQAKLEAAFREAGVGQDGFIEFDEFCTLING